MAAMREPTYYTLAALLEGRTHGYAILEKVRDMTNGRVKLTAGTLYGILDRLVDEGMIERAGSEIVRGRARQYFEITDRGSGAVLLEADRHAEDAAVVQRAVKAGAGRRSAGNRPAVPGVSFAPFACPR